MLFSGFVLVSVNGEHDGLEQRVNLGHGDETAKMGNVTRLGLKEEQEVSIFLGFVVIGKEALLHVGGIFEMAGDFILLQDVNKGLGEGKDMM